MHYVDTSLIVALVTTEPGTAPAQKWLSAQPMGEVAISDWTIAETSSALSIKLRTGQVTVERRATAMAGFNQLLTDVFIVLEVTSSHFRTAARFADQHALGLRAADALHLAIAAESGSSLATLDHRLAAAAPELGVPVTRL